jgi:plastocyanin
MSRSTRLSIVGALAVFAFSVLFAVLPSRGSGTNVKMGTAQERYRFRPATIRVRLGGAITFFNDSGVTHTATCPRCSFDTRDVLPGMLRVVRANRTGTFNFFCRYHAGRGMTGTIVVSS